jgi:hypothetical protein
VVFLTSRRLQFMMPCCIFVRMVYHTIPMLTKQAESVYSPKVISSS